jgi:hypothetical protein
VDTRTGHIREIESGQFVTETEVVLTSEQAERLQPLLTENRPDLFADMMHTSARPYGLTDDEWRSQKNAAKRIRRERRREVG